jgi:hypothetical protein
MENDTEEAMNFAWAEEQLWRNGFINSFDRVCDEFNALCWGGSPTFDKVNLWFWPFQL